MELKEMLEKAFDAGYNTSVAYNCGSCEGAFDSFEDWYKSIISLLPKVGLINDTCCDKLGHNADIIMSGVCSNCGGEISK